jgi:hypothetical protein
MFLGKVQAYDSRGFSLSGRLLSEASKSWEYVVSDKMVHVFNPAERNPSSPALAEDYYRGECWFEVLIGTSTDYFVAIVRAFDDHGFQFTHSFRNAKNTPRNTREHGANGNSAVLVDSVQFMKLPQKAVGCWRPCRSIIWLKRFDKRDSFIRYSENLLVESSPLFGVGGISEDRELGPVGVGVLEAGERPNSLIKSGSQTLEHVRSYKENGHMRVLDVNAVKYCIPFGILLGDYSIGITDNRPASHKGVDCDPQLVKVYLRPLGLETGIG